LTRQPEVHTDLILLERMADSRFRSDAWRVFVDRYTRLFYRWFDDWAVDPQAIEDVFQDSMIRVFKSLDHFERQRNGSFRAWLRVIARRSWTELSIESNRRIALRQLDPAIVEKWLVVGSSQAENELIELFDAWAREELLELAHARVRRRVDPENWETYRRVVTAQEAPATVAKALGIDKSKVYDRVSYLRKLIREEMASIEGAND